MAKHDSTEQRGWAQWVGVLGGTLGLYAAIGILLQATLAAVLIRSEDRVTHLSAIFGMIVVFLVMVVLSARELGADDSRARAVGALERAPDPTDLGQGQREKVDKVYREAWTGVWYCHWRARDASGSLRDYVSDTVRVLRVDPDTAELEAESVALYYDRVKYQLRGRVFDGKYAYLYYRYPPPLEHLAGIAILKVNVAKLIAEGWWMGSGGERAPGDVDGLVQWTKAERYVGHWDDEIHPFSFVPNGAEGEG